MSCVALVEPLIEDSETDRATNMSERERFYRFMYYDLFLGGLNIYFRKKIVVEVKIKKDKES